MFDFSDARFYGIVGILLILVIGYFVYLMYSDLVMLKKQVVDLTVEDFTGDYREDDEEDYDGDNEEEWDENDDEYDNPELEKTLQDIMDGTPEAPEPALEQTNDPEPAPAHEEPQLLVAEPQVKAKRRGRKAKAPVEPESEPTPTNPEEPEI